MLRNKLHALLSVAVVVASVAATICLGIEVLNAKADFCLPVSEHGKWRDMDAYTVQLHATQQALSGGPARDPREAEQAAARTRLRQWVSTVGLLEYPLVLGGCVVATVAISSSRNRLQLACGFACLLILVACGMIAVYRGYYSCLV